MQHQPLVLPAPGPLGQVLGQHLLVPRHTLAAAAAAAVPVQGLLSACLAWHTSVLRPQCTLHEPPHHDHHKQQRQRQQQGHHTALLGLLLSLNCRCSLGPHPHRQAARDQLCALLAPQQSQLLLPHPLGPGLPPSSSSIQQQQQQLPRHLWQQEQRYRLLLFVWGVGTSSWGPLYPPTPPHNTAGTATVQGCSTSDGGCQI